MPPIRVMLVSGRSIAETTIANSVEIASDILLVALSATQASVLQVCAAAHPDVVLLDVVQMEPGAETITRAIHRHYPQTKILIHAHTPDRLDSFLKAGAGGYILDTTSPADLLAAIRSVHSGKTVVSLDIMRYLLGAQDKSSQKIHS